MLSMCADRGVGCSPYSPRGEGRLSRFWVRRSIGGARRCQMASAWVHRYARYTSHGRWSSAAHDMRLEVP
jgi:aryl-alcohol dehydrogenase-like predicted oxidoreductase